MIKNKQKRIKNDQPAKVWFWLLSFVFLFAILSYGYCIRAAIVSVVVRQDMQSELSTLSTKVIDLEAKYIKIKSSITEELARELGFVPVKNQKFVTRKTAASNLSLVVTSN